MKHDFEKINQQYPLPEVIERSGVKLTKNGREFVALCPFHADKTPSFTVYNAKGDWKFHCFGCGAGGDALDYVKERYGCREVRDAIEILTGEAARQPMNPARYSNAVDPYAGYVIGRPPTDAPRIVAGSRTPALLNPKRVDDDGKPRFTTYTPSAVYPYCGTTGNLIGYVLRVEFDDRKITPGIWWMKNEATGFEGWSHGEFPSPRPVYGRHELAQAPEAQVLIVEGEKCKDAAARLFDGSRVVPISWMGGCKAVHRTSWDCLKDRSVLIWPDCDAEGWRTVTGWWRDDRWNKGLIEIAFDAGAKVVKVVDIPTGSRAKGWDIADAVSSMSAADIKALMRDKLVVWTPQDVARFRERTTNGADQAGDGGGDNSKTVDDIEQSYTEQPSADRTGTGLSLQGGGPDSRYGAGTNITPANWQTNLLRNDEGNLKASSLHNAGLLMNYCEAFKGIFAWNDFAKEVYIMRTPPWANDQEREHPWTPRKIKDPDVTATTMQLEPFGLSVKTNDIGKVITRVAEYNKYNHVVDRLNSLQWDGHPRLWGGEHGLDMYEPWVTRYLGVRNTPIARAFGVRWMVGAVARAMRPGCKMDTMLILEGAQGLKKSTALNILADAITPHVFTDQISAIGSKDAGVDMQGVWIIELAELDALGRAEVNAIKAFLTRKDDRFRRPYGKVSEEFPRSCVFAGSVNPVDGVGYLRDATGGRRFWPIKCEAIDVDALRRDAEQLWAEAVHLYVNNEPWWLTDAERLMAEDEQSERYEEDPWAVLIDEYVYGRHSVTIDAIMSGPLKIEPERRTKVFHKRIVDHLTRHGWKVDKSSGKTVFRNPRVLDVDAA